ncbi:hypothetical protein [Xenorhabdus nematophila]|nr:hypothetical protein [Xenorhabdus nematophila]
MTNLADIAIKRAIIENEKPPLTKENNPDTIPETDSHVLATVEYKP